MEDFQLTNWALLDLQYEYLDDGFKITATTDVPCHLYCRMTKVEPEQHSKPSFRRGIQLPGDVRFCFVVYEDNEQDEAGDTLTHTFLKGAWPYCEHRWFYFVGYIDAVASVSQSCIFHFHFPAPPPEPPPPIYRIFYANPNNRTIQSSDPAWVPAWNGARLWLLPWWNAPLYQLESGTWLTVSYGITRNFLSFDTSPLPATALIQSAFITPYVFYIRHTASVIYPFWQITKGHQSDPVEVGDWGAQNPETQILGEIDYRDLTLNQYNDIPLNQAGYDHILAGAPTLFCLRSQLDVLRIAPPLGENQAMFRPYQYGARFRPLLKISYYPA